MEKAAVQYDFPCNTMPVFFLCHLRCIRHSIFRAVSVYFLSLYDSASVQLSESRSGPAALHHSQIETAVQNTNASLFCVQPSTSSLPYCMMELSVTMVTVVTSGNSIIQIVLLIALGMLPESGRND